MGHLGNWILPQHREMGILTVESKIYKFGIFSNKGILI